MPPSGLQEKGKKNRSHLKKKRRGSASSQREEKERRPVLPAQRLILKGGKNPGGAQL